MNRYICIRAVLFAAVLCFCVFNSAASEHRYMEDFTTTQYTDTLNTTACWDTATGQLKLHPFNITLVGSYDTPTNAYDVFVRGDFALVAEYGHPGLIVLDVSAPSNPTFVTSLDFPQFAQRVELSGNYAYVGLASSAGLYVVDFSDPASPFIAGNYTSASLMERCRDIEIDGDYAYIAAGMSGVVILDISNPTSPSYLGRTTAPQYAYNISFSGDYVYSSLDSWGWHIIDVSNPTSPIVTGSYRTPGSYGGHHVVSGDRCYLTGNYSGTSRDLMVLDISDPTSPTLIGVLETPKSMGVVALSGDYLYACEGGPSDLLVIDVSDPSNPLLIDRYETNSTIVYYTLAGEYLYAAAGADGIKVLEIAEALASPIHAGDYATPDAACAVSTAGDYAYVADQSSGLQVLDISDPVAPAAAGHYATPGSAYDVAVAGDYAYVTDTASGLLTIDISDPTAPTLAGSLGSQYSGHASVEIAGNYAFVAGGDSGFQSIDISDPTNPTLAGSYDGFSWLWDVVLAGDHAYATDVTGGLQVLDISDPRNPSLVGNYVTPGQPHGIALAGDYALITDNSPYLLLLDVSDPSNPQLISSCNVGGATTDVITAGDIALVACKESGLQVVSISDPLLPVHLGGYDTPGNAFSVTVSGDYAFVGDRSGGVQVIEVFQRRFDRGSNAVQSLIAQQTIDPVSWARLTTTQVDSIQWELSTNGGIDWEQVPPDGSWYTFETEGNDFLWRSTLVYEGVVGPACSELSIEIPQARVGVDPASDVTNCSSGTSFRFWYDTILIAAPSPEVRGYEVTFSVDPAVAMVSKITQGPFLKIAGSTLFFTQDNGGGSHTVTCAILGGASGATGDGDLFRVDLTPVVHGVSAVALTNLKVTDVDNNPVLVIGEDGTVQVDCVPATMEVIAEPEDQYYNSPPSFSNFGFDDEINLHLAEYRLDTGGWDTLFVGIDTVAWDDDGFALPETQFDSLSEGPRTVYFRVADDAGNWNGDGRPDRYGWRFVVDRTPPAMELIAEAQGEYYNVPPTFSNFGFDDDKKLDIAEYRIDSGPWIVLFSGIGAGAWDSDGFPLPGFGALSEGSHTVYFRVADDAGNWNGGGTPDTYSWQFLKDVTPPSPPAGFTALPGHNKIHLAWHNPSGDPTFAATTVRRVSWQDYPEYSFALPSYPTNETERIQTVVTGDSAFDDDPVNPRGIYYYAAFTFDSAGNYSAFDAGAADRSTSYRLGDIDSNGAVEPLDDLLIFSNAFGTVEGGPGWVPESDFGPTDDYSRFGVPEPDDVIDFEDLMIFAMNYGNVWPTTARELLATDTPAELEERVVFSTTAERNGDAVVISVTMENEAAALKGVRMIVDYGWENELVAVQRGELLSGKSDYFLGIVPAIQGKVDIGVAALGIDRPIAGSGELARIVVRPANDAPIQSRLEQVTLRNVNNEREEVLLPEEVVTPFVPAVSALLQNHPNPFNPVTAITFDVATPGRVTITVFDVSGRLVRTLVDEHRGVGRHRVEWDGLDASTAPVSSGVYFYQMTAPGYGPVAKKMVLLR